MSDPIADNSQTGEPSGQAGLSHIEQSETPEMSVETKLSPAQRNVMKAIKVLAVLLIVIFIGFGTIGLGSSSEYTQRPWLKTVITGGGLFPKVFSPSSSTAMRAASETARGMFESNKGDYAEAEKSYRRGVDAYKKIDALNTVAGYTCIVGLGRSLNELKRESDAQEFLRQSVDCARKVFGEEHETVAIASRELAFSFARQKKYSEAQSFYQDALKLDTKGLGAEHFDVAYDMSCVGEMAFLEKDYPTAIKNLSDSIAIYKKARGEFHPSFFWVEESLAKAYYESGAYADAARQFENVLSRADRIHGTPGKDYLRDLAWLSWSYHYDHNVERARVRAVRLKSLLEKKSDSDLLNMIDVVESNADILLMLNEYEPAVGVFERLMKLQEVKFGPSSPEVRRSMLLIAQCYERAGKTQEAAKYRAKAEEF